MLRFRFPVLVAASTYKRTHQSLETNAAPAQNGTGPGMPADSNPDSRRDKSKSYSQGAQLAYARFNKLVSYYLLRKNTTFALHLAAVVSLFFRHRDDAFRSTGADIIV